MPVVLAFEEEGYDFVDDDYNALLIDMPKVVLLEGVLLNLVQKESIKMALVKKVIQEEADLPTDHRVILSTKITLLSLFSLCVFC